MITHTERATVLSVLIGIFALLIIRPEKFITTKLILSTFIIVVSLLTIMSKTYSAWGGNTLLDRLFINPQKTFLRLYMVIPTLTAVIYEPFGSVSSDYYNEIAEDLGWTDRFGRAISPHNHFATLFRKNGIFGIIILTIFFRNFLLKLRYVRLFNYNRDWILLASGCVAGIIHSLMHNAGFFNGGFETNIMFGMLWAATPKINHLNSLKINGDNIELL